MNRVARYAIVVAIGALVVVLMLAFRRAPTDIRTGTVGRPAQPFSLERLETDSHFAVSPGDGTVLVVNFFASWCIPCKQENPALVRVWERYRGSDVQFVGVLYQDSREAGLRYDAFHGRSGDGPSWLIITRPSPYSSSLCTILPSSSSTRSRTSKPKASQSQSIAFTASW